jgi:hypothetical protein
MSSPQKLTWKTAICWSLFICYVPFSWVVFVAENRILWIKICPLLPGISLVMLFQQLIRWHTPAWVSMTTSGIVSFGILLGVFILIWRLPKWNYLAGAFAAAFACFLSWVAYGIYRA